MVCWTVTALKVKTANSRFTRALKALKVWMVGARHLPIAVQAEALARKLRGLYQYYGVPGNSKSIASRTRSGPFEHRCVSSAG